MELTRRRSRRRFSRGLLLFLSPLSFYLFILLFIDRSGSNLINPGLRAKKHILWVIAHPDDESFFFAPSIIGLSSKIATSSDSKGGDLKLVTETHLLSLSTGDNEGLGQIRKLELMKSCEILGISHSHCVARNHGDLPDDPNIWWNANIIQELVHAYVEKWNIDSIITFDDYGVSGHSNHRAIHTALIAAQTSFRPFPSIYVVKSTNLLMKFTSLWSLPFSYFNRSSNSSLFISSPMDYYQTRSSFSAHESQSRWFRTLFVNFSRYLWFVGVEEVEL